ncbi:MAG: sigma-70 family RNA polymerase sigma factor [Planctomycetota bacterium]|nr:sigma-70 family RNA polymerase sigma factor [Planctomycetota bacterium]
MAGWTDILLACADRAYLAALRVTGDPSLAEDAVQEAYLRLLGGPVSDLPSERLRGYLLKTVHSVAVDIVRSSARRRGREEEAAKMGANRETADPADIVAAGETATAARRALAALPVELRLPVSLCCEQGLSHREAAEILDIPEKTVTDRLHRGLDRLRAVMAAAGYAACGPAALGEGLGSLGLPPAPAGLVARLKGLAGAAPPPAPGAGSVPAGGETAGGGQAGAGKAGAKAAGREAAGSEPAGAAESGGGSVGGNAGAGADGARQAASLCGKGGLVVKIGLGAAAVGLAVWAALLWPAGGPGRSEEPTGPAGKAAAPAQVAGEARAASKFATPVWDPGAEWEREGNFAGCGLMGYFDGPREGILAADSIGLYNWFAEGADNRLRTYDPATERYYTVAGTTHGYLDGPFSRARFAINGPNSGYVSSISSAMSPDGRYMYLSEGRLGVLRRLDFQKREVVTISNDKRTCGAMAADSKGNLYIVGWSGGIRMSPDGKIEQLNINPGDLIGHGFCIVYDEKNNRIYGANRGNQNFIAEGDKRYWYIGYWDLNAGGKFTGVLPQPRKGEKTRAQKDSGPFEGTWLHCPGGICWGPDDPDYRFLYYGGGDDHTFYRLDLEKKYWVVFGSPAPRPPGNYKAAKALTNCRFGDRKDLPCLYIQEWCGTPIFDADGNMYFPEALNQNLIRYRRVR